MWLGVSCSTSTFFPPTHCQRGASSAACGLRCHSIMFCTTCTWAWGCIQPPMMPKGPTGLPSFVRKPGMIVWYGRLPPRSAFSWASSNLKFSARSLKEMPVPGSTMPEPKPRKFDWMSDTMLPSPSAQQK